MTSGWTLRSMRWASAWLLLGLCAGAPAHEQMPVQKLRVCIWPDYFGSTFRDPITGKLSGLDIDMAHELAQSLRLPAVFVDTRPNDVASDLAQRRCDISMSAWAISDERKRRMRMAIPHLRSDVYAVVNRGSQVVRQWEDIDRPGVVIGVVASSYFETNIASHFRLARVVALPFRTLKQDLQAGRLDVLLTNFSVGEMMARSNSWVRSIAPTVPVEMTEYAYVTALDRPAWSDYVDRFVVSVRKDGRLYQAARRHGMDVMVIR